MLTRARLFLRRVFGRSVLRGNRPKQSVTGFIDVPAESEVVVTDAVTIRGWAILGGSLPERVELFLDGSPLGPATLGVARPDVAQVIDLPCAAVSGFERVVPISGTPLRTVEVAAVAFGRGDVVERFAVVRFRWEPGAPAELPGLRGRIDVPAEGDEVATDVITLYGWALLDGKIPRRVEVFIDGSFVGRAMLGLPRPDVARSFDVPDAVISGFQSWVTIPGEPDRLVDVSVVALGEDGTGEQLEVVRFRWERPLAESNVDREAQLRVRVAQLTVRQASPPQPGIRLGVFTHRLDRGGAQHYLLDLLRVFGELPDLSAFVVAERGGDLEREIEELGVPVHVTGPAPVEGAEPYEGRLAELAAWMQGHDPNVMLVNTLGMFMGADLAARLGIPCVWAIHESYPIQEYWHAAYGPGLPDPYVRRQALGALSTASLLVFAADATRNLFEPHLTKVPGVTARYGIDLEAIDAFRSSFDREISREDLSLPEGATVIVCLGTVEPRKSQTCLAKAFAMIAERHPNAYLVIVGALGDAQSEALKAYVYRIGLSERIWIVDLVEDVRPWLGVADVFVCASVIESLPIGMLEAMAFEVPVLATRIFGIPEVIEHGHNGYLVESADIAALAQGLDAMLGLDEKERRRFADRCVPFIRSLDYRRYASGVMTLLRTLVADPDVNPSDVRALLGAELSR